MRKICYLILALTTRCNLRCRYCYHGDVAAPLDMSEPVLRRAMGLAAAGGAPFHLQLTGGEPTLAPELIQMALDTAGACDNCRSVGIQTNATRLTPPLLRLLKAPNVQVGVSLDGPPEIHEWQRGLAAQTLQGLQRLEAAGIPFRVTTVVTRANASTLDRLVLCLAGFNQARGIGLDLLVHKGRVRDTGGVMPAGAAQLVDGLRRMLVALDAVNARRQRPLRLRERDLVAREGASAAFCHACRGESLAVHPDGRLFSCGQTLGDADFMAGTVDAPQYDAPARLQKYHPAHADCRTCDLEDRCPGDCPSRLHYNMPETQRLACTMYRAIKPLDKNTLYDMKERCF